MPPPHLAEGTLSFIFFCALPHFSFFSNLGILCRRPLPLLLFAFLVRRSLVHPQSLKWFFPPGSWRPLKPTSTLTPLSPPPTPAPHFYRKNAHELSFRALDPPMLQGALFVFLRCDLSISRFSSPYFCPLAIFPVTREFFRLFFFSSWEAPFSAHSLPCVDASEDPFPEVGGNVPCNFQRDNRTCACPLWDFFFKAHPFSFSFLL